MNKIEQHGDYFNILHKTMRIMRLSLFLILVSTGMAFSASSYSQNTKFSLSFENATVKDVLKTIESQSEFLFFYQEQHVDLTRRVNLTIDDKPVEEILDNLFEGTDNVYVIRDRQIVIGKAPKEQLKKSFQSDRIELNLSMDQLQQKQVSGRVTDSNGSPVPGASVIVKGTTTGTVTNANGEFSLNVDASAEVLQFSFIGMSTQEVVIGERTTINVVMDEETIGLDEVVAIGYGVARKSDLTGSVGSISSERLLERPAINVEQSMSGRIAGVQVQENSGRPGGNTKIAIRGYSSFNASNEPLYVVDGIIWPQGIGSLNPYDIESIDVLKDASSTAIYGTRGSNGVIMITTKRGTDTGGVVRYNSYASVNWLPEDRKLDVLNSKEYLFIEEEQYRNAAKFDPEGFESGKYINPIDKRMNYLIGNTAGNRELFYLDDSNIPQPIYDVDWQDVSTRTAISQSHNLSYTGGDNLTNYGLFLGYSKDNGIVKRSYAERYSIRGSIDRQMKDWLKVGGTLNYARKIDGGIDDANSYDVLRYFVEHVPFIPYKYEDGSLGYAGDYQGLEVQDSPLAILYEKTLTSTTNSFNGSTYITAELFPGLKFTSDLGVNILNNLNYNFTSSRLRGRRNDTSVNSRENLYWQWSNRLNFDHELNESNLINLLAGIETRSYESFYYSARTRDMPDDYFLWNNLGSGATPSAPGSSATDFRMESYFGRLNYSLLQKYLFTITGRIDGSSKFGADNKYAFFPSGAFAWRVSEENFLRDSRFISNFKLRVSYGLTGNSEIGSYRSLANLSTNSYVFNNRRATGTAIGRLANPILQWEKTEELDLGMDIGFFNNRLSVEGDYFHKKTYDLLFDAPVPSTSGYSSVTKNIGSIENKGFELSVNSINIRSRYFSWSTNFNISTLENKVLALGENDEDILYGFKQALILRVGESAGSIFGHVRDGVWSTAEEEEAAKYGLLPGDAKIVDQNNDFIIDNDDRVIIGKGIPDFYGAFSNSFTFNNFDFIIELQYSYGNDIFNNHRNSGEARQGIANSFATVLNAWTPENQDAVLEQVRPTGAYYSYLMDTRKLEDGSFLRGKNLSLGYSLPQSVASNLGINNLRVYTSFQNFFILTKYQGYDPEVSNYHDNYPISQGMAYSGYPKPRTLLFGIDVSF